MTIQPYNNWNPPSPIGLESLQKNAVKIHVVDLGNVCNFQLCPLSRAVETPPYHIGGETLSDSYEDLLRTRNPEASLSASGKTFVMIFVK